MPITTAIRRALLVLAGLSLLAAPAHAQYAQQQQPYQQGQPPAYGQQQPPPAYGQQQAPADEQGGFDVEELVSTGHRFFGQVSGGLATLIEQAVAAYGQPNAYILGEEAGGAFFGGLRYGEGRVYTRATGENRVFWQGPTLGLDFGGDGARTMILVYNLSSPQSLYTRFAGVDGSAYFIGGFGMTMLTAGDVVLVPVRAGVGGRLGINVGYLKFTPEPTWNPF